MPDTNEPPENWPATRWLAEARRLHQAGAYGEALTATGAALAQHPDAPDLLNIRGVLLRLLRRPREALAALERALAIDADHFGARVNAGNVSLDLGEADRAAALFAGLAEAFPDQAAHRVGLGRARLAQGRRAEGLAELKAALALDPALAGARLHLAGALAEDDLDAAMAVIDEALAREPGNLALSEGKAVILRTAEERTRLLPFLEGLERRFPDVAWVHLYLGDLLADDAPRAEAHLRRGLALDPHGLGAKIALIQHLTKTTGPEEGRNLEEAHGLALTCLDDGPLNASQLKVVRNAFSRVCDFPAMARLGDLATLGRAWVGVGLHTALMLQLPRVETDADRRELLRQHQQCGEAMMAAARRRPLSAPAPRARDGRIRLGLISADLRRHPVGYFVEPLFEHPDRERFELFVYALDPPGAGDPLQALFEAGATRFRRLNEAGDLEIARAIAADQLDVLVELGGTTAMNRLPVLAWKPAPLQLSWLGYPHSAGLPAIDGLICDPFNVPPDRSLLAEAPVMLPRSWIALGEATFSDALEIDPVPPDVRNGALTFGTANNPYKYTPTALRAWAEVTAAVEGARFAFIRPEAAAPSFRAQMTAAFGAAGVAPERLIFRPVRGAHMGWYNDIDVSLDTFPLTGGTTTVEALWMGVPVVSLRGPAFYERLSASILANAGLADLVADDVDQFKATAVALAGDRLRRSELRAGLRARLKASPLGDRAGFARDFYDAIAGLVEDRRAVRPGKQT